MNKKKKEISEEVSKGISKDTNKIEEEKIMNVCKYVAKQLSNNQKVEIKVSKNLNGNIVACSNVSHLF